MNDLNTAIITLGILCVVALAAGWRISKQQTVGRVHFVATAAGLLMAGYLTSLWNRPILAEWLPMSSLVILANWLPVWGCFFSGIYLAMPEIHLPRRVFVGAVALSLCGYSAVAPLTGTAPKCVANERPGKRLQFQTTPFTCSAACAASLLRLHGIDATEGELAELCLTREGTHWMGLFRGLKLKTAGTVWDVAVKPIQTGGLLEERRRPCVLSVDIDTARFEKGIDHGFKSDCGHSVIYLQHLRDDCITVFDPSPDFGIDYWDSRVLDCVQGGVELILVPRDPNNAKARLVSHQLAMTLWNQPLTAGL